MLLSLTGAQLFATSLGASSQATLASSPGGRSIVAWTVENTPSDHDIKAQLFDASGNKLGGVITVASGAENQYSPTVAINAAGQFAVAWTIDFSTTDTDVHATLFRADGSRVKDDFGVATSWKREYDPSVGIDARGDFTVSYTYQFASDDTDVKAVQFDANANLLRSLDVAVSTRLENHSHVTEAADGRFAVSYLVNGSSTARYFSSSGQPLESGQGFPPTPPSVPPPPHVPPPHLPPPPATPPILTGMLAGGYFSGPVGANRAPSIDLVGIGDLSHLGETTVTGDLFATGSLRSSNAAGVLTLHDSLGTVTLSLVGPAQGPFAALPSQFHFMVISATGAFARLHASGNATLHLFPSSHTLNLSLQTTGA